MSQIPIQYVTWWRQTQACSGLKGNYSRVQWYETNGTIVVDGEEYDGYWFRDGSRIVIAYDLRRDGRLVRHEMLHQLLGTGGHPPEYFVTRCGALVTCSACPGDETQRGVPADARVVPTESLTVTVSLVSSSGPAVSVDSGWVTIMVTARNDRDEPVWVEIPNDVGFGYVLFDDVGTFDFAEHPRWAFRAGEWRQMAFDRQFDAAGMTDTLIGFFGRGRSARYPITVAP